MKTCFTTLGCPDWDLDTVIRNGAAFGYAAVDFRGGSSKASNKNSRKASKKKSKKKSRKKSRRR